MNAWYSDPQPIRYVRYSDPAVPVLWFNNQKLLNQIFSVLVEPFVKRVIQFLNLFEDQKFRLRLEGGKAGHQLIDDATDGPQVRRPEKT